MLLEAIKPFLYVSIFSTQMPVPNTTQASASSLTNTGMPVSLLISLSKLRNREEPPVMMMPWSIISDASSGGVLSRVLRTASTIFATGSAMPVHTWLH